MKKTLRQAITELVNGIRLNDCVLYIHKTIKGRFREEQNLEIHVRNHQNDIYLLYAKVFYGRPPSYAPWVELFDIEDRMSLNGQMTSYFGSDIEDMALRHLTVSLEPGARIFVEYYNDCETRYQLEMGFPPALSRLGNKMYQHGCTWFKDWYFPEGFMEGNQKLQGEKPFNAQARERHMRAIFDDALHFVQESRMRDKSDEYTRRALARADAIVSTKWAHGHG
jgi:hypothetical protein